MGKKSKLDIPKILAIASLKRGDHPLYNYEYIAALFGVTPACISQICTKHGMFRDRKYALKQRSNNRHLQNQNS